MTPPLPPAARHIAPDSRRPVLVRAGDALFTWKRTEPARLYLYGLVAAVLVVLAVVGTVTEDLASALTGVAAALLVGVPGAAAVRASVVSPATRDRTRLEDSQRYAALIRRGGQEPPVFAIGDGR